MPSPLYLSIHIHIIPSPFLTLPAFPIPRQHLSSLRDIAYWRCTTWWEQFRVIMSSRDQGQDRSWRILEPRDWKSTAIKNGKSWVGDPLENLMNIIFLCFHELRGGVPPIFCHFLEGGCTPIYFHYLGVPPLCSIYWFRGSPPPSFCISGFLCTWSLSYILLPLGLAGF